jgi:hypothetical protein
MVDQTSAASHLLDKEANSLSRIVARFSVERHTASDARSLSHELTAHDGSTMPVRRAG